MKNKILLLPAYHLAVGLDAATRQETSALAYDLSQYVGDFKFPRTGASLWEGRVVCDDAHECVRYPGRVRRATVADFGLLITGGHRS